MRGKGKGGTLRTARQVEFEVANGRVLSIPIERLCEFSDEELVKALIRKFCSGREGRSHAVGLEAEELDMSFCLALTKQARFLYF